MILALDTESSYTKERDIKSLGVRNYVEHPETDHYLLSLAADNGWEWAGAPRHHIRNLDADILLSHNAAYDQTVCHALAPTRSWPEWNCTADLAAYLQSPRALAVAAEQLLDLKVDKSTREFMRGKDYRTLPPADKARVDAYALGDAKTCLALWQKYSHLWPEYERRISRHTHMMCRRGVKLDLPRVREGIEILKQVLFNVEKQIPWNGELNRKGDEIPITSPKELALECRRRGIPPPVTTNTKDERFDTWADEWSEKAPFVKAIQEWRKTNRMLRLLESMLIRVGADSILAYSLKYFGASHTGRWAGDAGLNMHNLAKVPLYVTEDYRLSPVPAKYTVDSRGCIIPRKGKFVIADQAQIEARIAIWFAKNQTMLDLLRGGMDIYEAHARQTMNFRGQNLKTENPEMRNLAKVRVLSLGFGAGAKKCQATVRSWTGKEISQGEAQMIVNSFRNSNPGIVRCWDQLERALHKSRGDVLQMELPSGRIINYWNITDSPGYWCGRSERGGKLDSLWGSKLFENAVQATARDLFAHNIVSLEEAGYPVVMHVHDEVVCETDDAEGVKHTMTTNLPEWAKGLPVEVEAKTVERYTKL